MPPRVNSRCISQNFSVPFELSEKIEAEVGETGEGYSKWFQRVVEKHFEDKEKRKERKERRKKK